MVKIYEKVSATNVAWNNTRVKTLIKTKSKYMNKGVLYLESILNIKTNVIWDLFRSNTKIRCYGYITDKEEIFIDSRYDLKTNLNTLAHEAIHIQQIQSGKMKFEYDKDTLINIIWNDIKYPYQSPINLNKNKLNKWNTDIPWEIDAYKKEEYYNKLLVNHLKI